MERDARALVCVALVLIVTDVLLMDQNMWLTVPIACVASALLVLTARYAGLTLEQVGLARSQVLSGLRWGAGAALIALGGYLVVAAVPFGESALDDDTMPTTALQATIKVLVVIPLRTIVLEELAFRGVLWGLLHRRWGARRATAWSAAAFGLWHVPEGFRLIGSNEALESATDGSAIAAGGIVLAIVVFTALAGVLFAEMRRRSGSLVAPAALHWATNGLGTVLSAVK